MFELSGVAGTHTLVTVTKTSRVPVHLVNATLHEMKILKNAVIGILTPAVMAAESLDEAVCRVQIEPLCAICS